MTEKIGYVYLASPYSDPDPMVRERRYLEVAGCVARLANLGSAVYSPIVHWHEVAKIFALPKDHVFWTEQNVIMLAGAGCLYVLRLAGHETSKGVAEEISIARRLNVPMEFIDP